MKSVFKATVLILAALSGMMTLPGCGPAPQNAGDPVAPPAAAGTAQAPREIRIEVGDAMKFSVARIEAAAGETLRVTLINTSSAPKEAMGHNWVLLKTGTDATAYANAALKAKATDYIPADRNADVIVHTRLLGGGSRDGVTFAAPTEPGEYVFICTFPAHLQLGMKGVLVVR